MVHDATADRPPGLSRVLVVRGNVSFRRPIRGEEARKEADEAALTETNEGEAGDALTPNSGAQRRAAEKTGDAGIPE
ncbi:MULTISPECIES: hypothetical protein [Streptomyces]|uniref:hypothetical protein n=1 Tax=Streptomyces TaxID=1883 RepID=UPI00131C7FA1|nr:MULTISPECIES: hypothetical protein [Streptomyces]MBP2341410.1 hypothetical protein [Streptomyces virginiae]